MCQLSLPLAVVGLAALENYRAVGSHVLLVFLLRRFEAENYFPSKIDTMVAVKLTHAKHDFYEKVLVLLN